MTQQENRTDEEQGEQIQDPGQEPDGPASPSEPAPNGGTNPAQEEGTNEDPSGATSGGVRQ